MEEPPIKQRRTSHPWSVRYNKRCLISGCETPVYHDGKVYWSLCLLHLKEQQLGPFYPRYLKNGEDYK